MKMHADVCRHFPALGLIALLGSSCLFETVTRADDAGPVLSVTEFDFVGFLLGDRDAEGRAAAQRRMDRLLKSRIEGIDRVCGLREDQIRKLELAGGQDVRRLLERIKEIRQGKFEGAQRDAEIEKVSLDHQLRYDTYGDRSFFSKVLKSTLSDEQSAKFEQHQLRLRSSTQKITADNAADLELSDSWQKDAWRMSWLPDARRRGVLEFGKSLEIYTPDLKLEQTVADGQKLVSFDFSPDSKTVAIGNQGQGASLIEIATGQRQELDTEDSQPSVRFSPDGLTLATCGYGTKVSLWSVATGQRVRVLDVGPTEGGLTPVFSPDGTLLAVGHRNSKTKVFELATGNLKYEIPYQQSQGLKFNPQSTQLAICYCDGTFAVWDAKTGRQTGFKKTRAQELYAVDWSPDGTLLVASGLLGPVTIWKAEDLSVLKEFHASDWAIIVQFHPDGTRVSCTGGPQMRSPERRVITWAVP
jgi:WD40 repeat protein